MPILTKVEAKGWRGRLFLTIVTVLLTLGGITMVYPFLLMFAGAMRSDMDSADMSMRPLYLHDDAELVRKFLETKYAYNPILMNVYRQVTEFSFRDSRIDLTYHPQAVADLEGFMQQPDLPLHWEALGSTAIYQSIACRKQEELVALLRARFNDDLDAFNREQGSPVPSWWAVQMPMPNWASSRQPQLGGPLMEAYWDLQRESPPSERALVNLSGHFIERVAVPAFGLQNIEAARGAWQLTVDSYERITLPDRVPPPEQAAFRSAWLEYVYDYLHPAFIRADVSDRVFQDFLRQRFDSIRILRRHWRDLDADEFDEISLPGELDWIEASKVAIYQDFLQSLPPESLYLVGPEFAWREFLRERYGTPKAAATAHGMQTTSRWQDFQLPTAQMETAYVLGQTRALRWRYAIRNFRIVIRQMFVQGRAFFNTIIYVSLALIFALTLQPLGAYALSRFAPPGTWKMIFILVATMAFPPMVGMIPMFLGIQRLGLLNTYIALILPLMVNGMLIFLLKGFFDSIPKDLYHAAMIDGASELRIFWQITMSISKPILAVVALQTFSQAWMAFMYPLIVCPAEHMHVLAVWLQQFQLNAPGTAVFASILVASIPSMVIFIFAQRTIMKGIAVPSEK